MELVNKDANKKTTPGRNTTDETDSSLVQRFVLRAPSGRDDTCRSGKTIKSYVDVEIIQDSVVTGGNLYPRTRTRAIDREYRACRLSVTTWFMWYLRKSRKNITTIVTTINLVDRYVARCNHEGVPMSSLLRDMWAVGITCLAMTNKMFAGDLVDEVAVEGVRPPELPRADLARKMYPEWTVAVTERTIVKWELEITTRLNGALFLIEFERVLDVIFNHLTRAAVKADANFARGLDLTARETARSLFIKTVLEPTYLLRFRRWECMAAACLFALKSNNVLAETAIDDAVSAVCTDLGYADGTARIIECSRMLAGGCSLCFVTFPSEDMTAALRFLAGSYCEFCSAKTNKRT